MVLTNMQMKILNFVAHVIFFVYKITIYTIYNIKRDKVKRFKSTCKFRENNHKLGWIYYEFRITLCLDLQLEKTFG